MTESSCQLRVMVPAAVETPRGAEWAANAALGLSRWLSVALASATRAAQGLARRIGPRNSTDRRTGTLPASGSPWSP